MLLNKLAACIPMFAVSAVFGVIGCASDHPDDGGADAVLAINTLTGEQKEYPDEASVPGGWEVCKNDVCPEPVECAELDEASCLVRADCSGVYAGSAATGSGTKGGAEFCAGSDSGTEFCAAGFETCMPVAPSPTPCQPEQCSGAPSAAPKCAGASAAEPVCEGQKGGCAWSFRCP